MSRSYILTLKSSDQGAVQAKATLLSAGLGAVEVFFGVDGRKLSSIEYYKFMVGARSFAKHGQILTPGEVGCALSHCRMLEEFLNSNEQISIIFEDDVLIGERSVEMLQIALPVVRAVDILVACDQQGVDSKPFRSLPLAGHTNCYTVQKDDWGIVKRTCAYAVGRQAAEHILSIQNDGLCLADDFQALCPDGGRLLFCNAFSHLPTYDGSNIDIERQLQRPPPRPLIVRLRDELMKTISQKSGPVRRTIRSALGGFHSIGK